MRALLDGIRLALRAIARNPLRASLTVLGILIGVAAVVTVTALGAGGARRASARRSSRSARTSSSSSRRARQASGARGAQGSGVRLTEEDAPRDPARVDERRRRSRPRCARPGRSSTATRTGHAASSGRRCRTSRSRNWPVDARLGVGPRTTRPPRRRSCVLGSTRRRRTSSATRTPSARTVRIGRYPYRVARACSRRKGEAPFGGDQDDIVAHAHRRAIRARILAARPRASRACSWLRPRRAETTERAVTQIDAILRQRHRIDRRDAPPTSRSTRRRSSRRCRRRSTAS